MKLKKVAIIDDNSDVLKTLKNKIKIISDDTDTYTSLNDFSRSKSVNEYEVVLMDTHMPNVSDEEIKERIKNFKNNKKQKVFLITSKKIEKQIENFKYDDVIHKSSDASLIISKIQRSLGHIYTEDGDFTLNGGILSNNLDGENNSIDYKIEREANSQDFSFPFFAEVLNLPVKIKLEVTNIQKRTITFSAICEFNEGAKIQIASHEIVKFFKNYIEIKIKKCITANEKYTVVGEMI